MPGTIQLTKTAARTRGDCAKKICVQRTLPRGKLVVTNAKRTATVVALLRGGRSRSRCFHKRKPFGGRDPCPVLTVASFASPEAEPWSFFFYMYCGIIVSLLISNTRIAPIAIIGQARLFLLFISCEHSAIHHTRTSTAQRTRSQPGLAPQPRSIERLVRAIVARVDGHDRIATCSTVLSQVGIS